MKKHKGKMKVDSKGLSEEVVFEQRPFTLIHHLTNNIFKYLPYFM